MIRHQEVIQLVIAYTLAGAFVFTVIITCLSLIGWIKFADKKQQKKLFTCLIVELIAVSLGFFCGFLNFNPHQVAQDLVDQGKEIERLRRTNEETARELAQRSFIPLSTDNEKQFVNELSSFFRRWPAVTNIGLIVDTTEKRRRLWAEQMGKILSDAKLPVITSGGINMDNGRYDLVIFYRPEHQKAVEEFAKPFTALFQPPVTVSASADDPYQISIRLMGEPLFNTNGVIRFK